MQPLVIIQARTNSTRLPAKILLPLPKLPLIVVAAKRAANSGLDVLVITSDEPSDDFLCSILDEHDIKHFRGSLANTLERFVSAIEGLDDEKIIVRLTGDNVFPDGVFIEDLIKEFRNKQLEYLACTNNSSGLPYGVSAEITLAKYLRMAHADTSCEYHREHVTPWIVENMASGYCDALSAQDFSAYRCTIDTLDDYLKVAQIFQLLEDPLTASIADLVALLKDKNSSFPVSQANKRLVLGAAQLGLNYGISNEVGQPSQSDATNLIRSAISAGVYLIDTARAYGNSESVISRALSEGWSSRVKVITKLDPLSSVLPNDCAKEVALKVTNSVLTSCRELRSNSLDVLLVHRASHLYDFGGSIWLTLKELKAQGVISALGVSVETPEEAINALRLKDIEYIQLPFNLIDNRWENVQKAVESIKECRSLIVHARSVFLQGILLSSSYTKWERANCSEPEEIINFIKDKSNIYCCGSTLSLCLRYVLSQKWIDAIVIGMETEQQLIKNLNLMNEPPFIDEELEALRKDIPNVPEKVLNPKFWS